MARQKEIDDEEQVRISDYGACVRFRGKPFGPGRGAAGMGLRI